MSLGECYVHGGESQEVPVHLNFGKLMLDRLQQYGDNIALVNATTGEEMKYDTFLQYSINLATSLTKLEIGKGEVVAIGSEKRITFIPTVLSIILTGATCTPYSTEIGKTVLRHQLSVAKPTYLICSKLFWEIYQGVLTACDHIKAFITLDESPENAIKIESLASNNIDVKKFKPPKVLGQIDTVFILYSSGTTGLPKGVRLTHINCILNILPDNGKFDSIQTVFHFAQWYHNYDIFMACKFLCAGKKITYVDEDTIPNMLECIEKYQVNMTLLLPHLLKLIIKEENLERFNLDSLKIIYSRGSPLHKKTIAELKQRLPKLQDILQGYGMTECGEPTSEKWTVNEPKPGSIGMAAPGVTLKVVDTETNLKLGPNQLGEIRVTGPFLMKGYIQIDPSVYLDEEGFFKTGDIGYYDNDKCFYIVDRIKDIINNRGGKVSPLQLETLLETHEKVLEAAVVGKPDHVCGELPTAFIVKTLESHVTEQELIDYVKPEVSPFMQLTGGVKFLHKLPRSPRGKILRRQLREMLNQLT